MREKTVCGPIRKNTGRIPRNVSEVPRRNYIGNGKRTANHRRRIALPVLRETVRRGEKRDRNDRIRIKQKNPRDPVLRNRPDLFNEIFGTAQYPADAVRKLMSAVALIVVKDYFTDPMKYKTAESRRRAIRDKHDAEKYLFNKHDDGWFIFSFGSVCKAIGVNLPYARRAMRDRTAIGLFDDP